MDARSLLGRYRGRWERRPDGCAVGRASPTGALELIDRACAFDRGRR